MTVRDERNVRERVRKATQTICGHGALSERLKSAVGILVPLLVNDFPTEDLRHRFAELMREFTAMDLSSKDDQQRIAHKILALYADVEKLER